MPRPRRNRRPPGNVHVVCTGRGKHDAVPFPPDLQIVGRHGPVPSGGTGPGPGPVTGIPRRRPEDLEAKCGTCPALKAPRGQVRQDRTRARHSPGHHG